jgi:hypothetical protein
MVCSEAFKETLQVDCLDLLSEINLSEFKSHLLNTTAIVLCFLSKN